MAEVFLSGTISKFRIGCQVSESFQIKNGLKQGETLLILLFNFLSELRIRNIQENEGLIFNWMNQILAYVDEVVTCDQQKRYTVEEKNYYFCIITFRRNGTENACFY